MFSFGGIFKRCSGCQLLWSDPNKQAGAYDAVNKDEHEDKEDPDMEPLSPTDIVFSQPNNGRRGSWSLDMESPIVRNQSPIVKSSSKSGSLERKQSFTGQGSPIGKTRTPSRDNSAFTISNSPIVKTKTPPRDAFKGGSSPVVKSKTPPRNALKASASSEHVAGPAGNGKSDSKSGDAFKASMSTDRISSSIDKTDIAISASTPNLSSKTPGYGPTVHSSKTSKKAKKTNSEVALQVVSVV